MAVHRFIAAVSDRGWDNFLLRPPGRSILEAPIGHWSHGIVFSRDGRKILVQNMIEKTIQVFAWDGAVLRPERNISLTAGPAALDTAWP